MQARPTVLNVGNQVKQRGFTLLELIGVLAVMAILAGALAPNLIALLDEGFYSTERDNLNTIAGSLERSIRNTKVIPSELATEWTANVAQYSAIAANRILENDKGFQRRLFIDPRFFSNVDQVFTTFVQGQGLASPPVAPRMMLVSRLDGSISQSLSTHSHFDAVWEQSGTASLVETKSLLIHRIHLSPLFQRIILSNSSAQQVSYQLEDSSEAAVAAASGSSDGSRTFYAITDSRLTLRAAPYPGGAVLYQRIVDSETSMRYELDGANWLWAK